jgi:CubicO group peptidase (beta-lactamase class C family)
LPPLHSNLELRVPVTPDTLFQSGSTGKIFTAAGILLLAQDGKLRLDDRLAMYYPAAPAAWHRISIRRNCVPREHTLPIDPEPAA